MAACSSSMVNMIVRRVMTAPLLRSSSLLQWDKEVKQQARRLHHAGLKLTRATPKKMDQVVGLVEKEVEVQVDREMHMLITEINNELAMFGAEEVKDIQHLNKSLQLLDLIQRLGIQRFFKHQITQILPSTYRDWSSELSLGSPSIAVLAFWLLRLHGYEVSTNFLEKLKDKNGEFSCFSEISDVLNLYRCGQLAFPYESKVMAEAKAFARDHLNKSLTKSEQLKTQNIGMEIKFALDYPRHCLLPRLESRSLVRQLWPGEGTINKCLRLAKLDMDSVQKLHQKEIEEAKRWWTGNGLDKLKFAREGIVKCHFSISAALYEPEYSAFRIAFTKMAALATLVDDLCEDAISGIHELKSFSEAFHRWDVSLLDSFPHHKTVLSCLCNTLEDIAKDSSILHGWDLLPFFKKEWENLITAMVEEGKWRYNCDTVSLDQYLKVARVTASAEVCILATIFCMGENIAPKALEQITKDSGLLHCASIIARFANDIVTFQREESQGLMNTSISCYMRENPGSTKEEAVNYFLNLMESTNLELEWESFKARAVLPESCIRAIVNFARTYSLVYKRADAFSLTSDKEYENLVKDYLYNNLV